MSDGKEWLHSEHETNNPNAKFDGNNNNKSDDDDDDSWCSADSNDTLQNFIQFTSHRNNTGLEEAISITYPFANVNENETFNASTDKNASDASPDEDVQCQAACPNIDTDTTGGAGTTSTPTPTHADTCIDIIAQQPGTLRLSTLLEEDDLVPLFDGAGWAGTRVWAAAIWGIKYLIEHYSQGTDYGGSSGSGRMSMCELGCGLGVPGMVWHQLGRDVVLTDQESIMTQMVENTKANFSNSFASATSTEGDDDSSSSNKSQLGRIYAEPLSWSREGFHTLLQSTGFHKGFDIVLNCDCVYEPLYGKSWELLVEVIDECLKVNPNCLVVTSVERRNEDGIDLFKARMEGSEHVGSVELIMEDQARDLELYITRGRIR